MLFSESYARLGRLQNQIALMFDRSSKILPRMHRINADLRGDQKIGR